MLTADQLAAWERDGYLAIPDVLGRQELVDLKAAASELEQRAAVAGNGAGRYVFSIFGEEGSRRLQQVGDPHEAGAEWMSLARHPAILDVVEELVGPNIQLYYSMLMMKPAGEGQATPWHQDLAFFPHDRARLVACQVYLDDATEENGCVRVAPGSHAGGLGNHYRDGHFTGKLEEDCARFDRDKVALPMRAGGMNVWHPLTVHSSYANRSARPRRALTLEYKDPGCRLLSGSFSSRVEVRPVGVMIRGSDPSGELLSPL